MSVVTIATYQEDVFLNPPIPATMKQLEFVLDKEKNPSPAQLDGDYLVINESVFRDLDRLGPRHPLRGYREFYQGLGPGGFHLIKEFKYPVKVFGVDFSSSFGSYDYLIINPGIRIYKRTSRG